MLKTLAFIYYIINYIVNPFCCFYVKYVEAKRSVIMKILKISIVGLMFFLIITSPGICFSQNVENEGLGDKVGREESIPADELGPVPDVPRWGRGFGNGRHGGRRFNRQADEYMNGPEFQEDGFPGMMRKRMMFLDRLRDEQPEMYRYRVRCLRDQNMQNMRFLKQHDPERFFEIKDRLRKRRFERLREMKHSDPEEFSRIMEQRKKNIFHHLDILRKTDPERYEVIKHQIEAAREYHRLKKELPDEAEHFLDNDPQLKQIIEKNMFGYDQ